MQESTIFVDCNNSNLFFFSFLFLYENEQDMKPIYRKIILQKTQEKLFNLEPTTFKYIISERTCAKTENILSFRTCNLLCQRRNHTTR